MRRRRRRRRQPLTATLSDHVGNQTVTCRPHRPVTGCHPQSQPPPTSRPTVPRLVAELNFVAVQRDTCTELLPGSPATIALSRDGNLVALLVMSSEEQARSLLGLPYQQRDRRADALWELDRRHIVEDECHAN